MDCPSHAPFVLQIINLTTHALFLHPTSHRPRSTSRREEEVEKTSKRWCDAGGSCKIEWEKKMGRTRRVGVYGMKRSRGVGYGEVEEWMGEMVIERRRRKGWKKLDLESNYQRDRSSRILDGKSVEDENSSLLASLSKHRRREDRSKLLSFIKYTDKHHATILILPSPPPESHLTSLSDDVSLADLVLPATHESLALHGFPVSKCQESDCMLDVQLNEGVRFVDIRIAERKGELLAYHGPFPQLVPFRTMLSQLYSFLSAHSQETVIFCIQQEAPSSTLFSSLVRSDMEDGISRGLWFLEDRIPQLGEVRGKAILMSRFGGLRDGGLDPWMVEVDGQKELRIGWYPGSWPDSKLEGFEWDCGGMTVRTQDWYEIYGFFNIPAKVNVLVDHLDTSARLPPTSHACLSFSSAASVPFALPPIVAKGFGWPSWGLGFTGVNERLRDWLLNQAKDKWQERQQDTRKKTNEWWRLRGIIPMDFYRSAELTEVLIAHNSLYTA